MRLAGLVHSSVVTGGEPVYVALDDLSVVLGANDSGKTRTLVVLHEELARLNRGMQDTEPAPPPLPLPDYEATLFVELSDAEAFIACSPILDDLIEDEDATPVHYTAIAGAPLTEYDRDWVRELAVEDRVSKVEAIETWLEILRRSAGLDDARFDPLFEALAASRTAAVLHPLSDLERPFLYLALDEEVARAEPVRSLLAELHADEGPGPVMVAPWGPIPDALPSAMWVPQQGGIGDELVAGLVDCVEACHELAGHVIEDSILIDRLDESGFRCELTPAFRALCGVTQMVVNDVLPEFVAERYWVAIEPEPITRSEIVSVTVESRDGARRFELDEAAAGLQMWLQLGVLEGIAALRELTSHVYSLVLLADDSPAVAPRIAAILQTISLLAAQPARDGYRVHPYFQLPALGLLRRDDTSPADVARLFEAGLDFASLFGGYCYFVDEPERHLHPKVARDAARWLRERIGQSGAQCIITTHSVPFLDLGEQAAYTYMWRDGDKVFSRPFEPEALHALDLLAGEMGFDRGELLTTVRTLLFVEGRNDQRVLEQLFGPELRRAGVAILPMHSVGRLHRVVEAEALFRYTGAEIRVLLDNDVAAAWDELRADPEALEAALRDGKHTERQAIAQLVKTARQTEREDDIEVGSIPEPDMFFMLDAAIVTELYDAYPGHEQAEAEWAEALRKRKQHVPRKVFRRERYGVPDEEALYVSVAATMRERGIVPEALAAVIEWLGGEVPRPAPAVGRAR